MVDTGISKINKKKNTKESSVKTDTANPDVYITKNIPTNTPSPRSNATLTQISK